MVHGFDKLVDLVKYLRSENGCIWDKEQTISSLKEDVLSEADELREAINNEDYENIKEEIGDLIWGLVLMTQIAEEDDLFNIHDVLNDVNDKVIRRHPHVFGDVKATTPEEAHKAFLDAKMKEKSSGPTQN